MKFFYFLSLILVHGQLNAEEKTLNTGTIEPLYGIELHDQKIRVRVKSYGCTKENSFTSQLFNHTDYDQLTLIRIKKDRCKRMPKIISLEFDAPQRKSEISNQKPVLLSNPLLFSSNK